MPPEFAPGWDNCDLYPELRGPLSDPPAEGDLRATSSSDLSLMGATYRGDSWPLPTIRRTCVERATEPHKSRCVMLLEIATPPTKPCADTSLRRPRDGWPVILRPTSGISGGSALCWRSTNEGRAWPTEHPKPARSSPEDGRPPQSSDSDDASLQRLGFLERKPMPPKPGAGSDRDLQHRLPLQHPRQKNEVSPQSEGLRASFGAKFWLVELRAGRAATPIGGAIYARPWIPDR